MNWLELWLSVKSTVVSSEVNWAEAAEGLVYHTESIFFNGDIPRSLLNRRIMVHFFL